MSAVVVATAFGGPDVLEIANQAPGEPGPGEALIAVRAAGVNPVDYKVYSGTMGADPGRLPMRLGSEAAGAVTGVSVGDTVLIHGAAGGVGVMAVQLAVERGATVVATGLPARHDFLRQLGAIPVEYGSGLMDRAGAAAPDGVDAALDLAGTDEALDVSFVLVPDRT